MQYQPWINASLPSNFDTHLILEHHLRDSHSACKVHVTLPFRGRGLASKSQRGRSYIGSRCDADHATLTRTAGDNSWMQEGPIDTTVNHGYQAQRAGALAFLPTRILDTRQDECIQRIREWVFRCKNQHPTCSHQGLADSRLPSRVIDVGYPPRLYESHGENAHYITLSHCWGTSQHFVTTSENIDDLETEIPWTSLPKTFQDAISITRSLGLGFCG